MAIDLLGGGKHIFSQTKAGKKIIFQCHTMTNSTDLRRSPQMSQFFNQNNVCHWKGLKKFVYLVFIVFNVFMDFIVGGETQE